MNEKEFIESVRRNGRTVFDAPRQWLSAAKVISVFWPQITRFKESGGTYVQALKLINEELDNLFTIECMQVVCSSVKREKQS